jgi:glycosyltransferase involved in cell wall biosynthesis
MKIVFIEQFLKNQLWNGRTMREIKGLSGTHTAGIFLAESLVTFGHNIIYYSKTILQETYNGVKYVNADVVETMDADIIFMTFNIMDFQMIYNRFDYFNKRVPLIAIMHTDFRLMTCDIPENNNINTVAGPLITPLTKKDVNIIQLCNNAALNATFLNCLSTQFEKTIIPNCIDINELVAPHFPKDNAFVFFPCVERGYNIAVEILNHFPHFKMYCNTYSDEYRHKMTPTNQTVKVSNTSKNNVYSVLSKSKYFVYPLFNTENQMIHCDTFGYVVLEALLHGVVVIAPPMEVFKELYGDAICYIDCDIPSHYLTYGYQEYAPFGYPLIPEYVKKIEWLENHPEEYQQYVNKGFDLKQRFSKETIGSKVNEYINTIVNNNLVLG